jgi:hypothetical protein
MTSWFFTSLRIGVHLWRTLVHTTTVLSLPIPEQLNRCIISHYPWSGDGLSVIVKCIQLKKTVRCNTSGKCNAEKYPPSTVLYKRTTKRTEKILKDRFTIRQKENTNIFFSRNAWFTLHRNVNSQNTEIILFWKFPRISWCSSGWPGVHLKSKCLCFLKKDSNHYVHHKHRSSKKIRENLQLLHARQCHGPHSKHDSVRKGTHKITKTQGLWLPTSLNVKRWN